MPNLNPGASYESRLLAMMEATYGSPIGGEYLVTPHDSVECHANGSAQWSVTVSELHTFYLMRFYPPCNSPHK